MDCKIVTVSNKSGDIRFDHRKNELLVSEDIKLNQTDDGKLCATFQDSRKQQPTFTDFVRDLCGTRNKSDSSSCSLIINDLSSFQYCTQKDGEYILFGGGVTFNGTNHDDKLTMFECQDTIVDLSDGNDTVKILDVNGFPADFNNNTIKTGTGNDTVTVIGNFNEFKNNKFYLGKGNDRFSAEINPNDDNNVTNSSAYDKMENVYMRNVSGSEVHATDGEKGWFEKDSFDSKTYTGNKLLVDGVDYKNLTTKSIPEKTIIVPVKKNTQKSEPKKTSVTSVEPKTTKANKKLTAEEVKRNIRLGELYYQSTGKPEVLENAYKKLEDYYMQ